MKEERINEIWAIFLLALSIIIFVSLFTFDPLDLPFYTSQPNHPVSNFAGIAGAYFAGILVFTIGKAGFIIPFLALLWAIGRFTGKVMQKFYVKLLGAAVLIVAVSSLLSMLGRYDSVERFSSGGMVGLAFSDLLIKYFGNTGSYIILAALLILALLLATQFLLFPVISTVFIKLTAFFKGAVKTISSSRRAKRMRPEIKVAAPRKEPIPQLAANQLKAMPKEALRKEPKRKIEISQPTPKPLAKKTPEPKKAAQPQVKAEGPASRSDSEAPKPEYILPSLDILDSPPPIEERKLMDNLENSAKVLEGTLSDFDLEVKVVKIEKGPVITRYELEPAPGIKISRISALSDNIALAMKAQSVRIVAPIPGKGTVGVEVPNQKGTFVYLKEVLSTKDFKESDSKLTIVLGKDIGGSPVIADLSDMPHLLIAGTTGSGKTVSAEIDPFAEYSSHHYKTRESAAVLVGEII